MPSRYMSVRERMSEQSMMVQKGDTFKLIILLSYIVYYIHLGRQRWITYKNEKTLGLDLFDSPQQKSQQRMLASFPLLLPSVWFPQIFELHQKLLDESL